MHSILYHPFPHIVLLIFCNSPQLPNFEQETYHTTALPNNTIKVTPHTPDTYRKLIHRVREACIVHHTYQIKQDRAYRIVIRGLHHSVPINDISEELNMKGHKVRNIINVKHRVSNEPLPLSLLTWNHKATIKTFLNQTSYSIEKSKSSHPDVNILSHNAQDTKTMSIQNSTVTDHSTASNAVDHMTQQHVRKLEIHLPNVFMQRKPSGQL